MRFLRRNQSLILSLAVMVLCSVMVVRQYLANQTAHLELREDFLLLLERGHAKESEHLFQMLVQDLPNLTTRGLVDDLQRTTLLVDRAKAEPESLLWKYQQSVKNEMFRRAEARAARALKRAAHD